MSERPGTFESLRRAMTSWRTASVALLSFSSGLPLGLVWIAIPDWMRSVGVDIRIVGLITLAQAPWTFKMVWSPLMDRYRPPFMGRRRGWAVLAQVALFATTLALAGVGHHPDTPWVVAALAFAMAIAAATQDIAIDAYAVDVLRKEEQGVAVGARIAVYRGAMYVAGGLSITLAGFYSWPLVNAGLALLYLPMILVAIKAPEPPAVKGEPKTLRQAIWEPFLGFLARDRALEILAFVLMYKFADNLGQALLRPFLVDMGYSDFDRGVALATIGLLATLAGAFIGGAVTTTLGLGHSLWLFGVLQIGSNLGYILLARLDAPDRALMYGALGFESLTQGLGTGAFSVLLLRMTQKRFSATQYALFSSLFGLPRIISGPITGFVVHATGWEAFFWLTILAGVPGLALLQRFAPLGRREPRFSVRPPTTLEPLTPGRLALRGAGGGIVALVGGALLIAAMDLLRAARDEALTLTVGDALSGVVAPVSSGGWLTLAGLMVFAVVMGLMTAAAVAARHGAAEGLGADNDDD